MPNNEQKKKTLAQKHKEMVNSEEFRKHHEEHKRKLKTDPEYRKWWENQLKSYNRLMPNHDSE